MEWELGHGLYTPALLAHGEVIPQVLQTIETPGHWELGAVTQVQGLGVFSASRDINVDQGLYTNCQQPDILYIFNWKLR